MIDETPFRTDDGTGRCVVCGHPNEGDRHYRTCELVGIQRDHDELRMRLDNAEALLEQEKRNSAAIFAQLRAVDALREQAQTELARWRRSFDGHVYVPMHKYEAMAAALRYYGDEDNWRQAEYDYTTFWRFLKNEEPWKRACDVFQLRVDRNTCPHCGQPKTFSESYPDGYCLCPGAVKPRVESDLGRQLDGDEKAYGGTER